MLAGAVATGGAVGRRRRTITFAFSDLAQRAPRRLDAALDLRRLRARVPDQDAALPVPRLDAGRATGRCRCRRWRSSPACSRRSPPTASCGSCCRSSRDAAQDFQSLILILALAVDPLRLGAGVHADERAADARLLVDRAARLHRARHLRPRPRGRRRAGRAAADGQPRARGRAAVLHHRAAGRARGRLGGHHATWAGSRSARRCWRRCS